MYLEIQHTVKKNQKPKQPNIFSNNIFSAWGLGNF